MKRCFLNEWMEALNITDEMLAGKFGVQPTTVQRWRRQPERVSLQRMGEVAKVMQVRLADLFRHPKSEQ